MKSFRNRLIRVLKMLPDKKKYYCYIILYIVSSVCCPFASASFISIIVKKFEDGISIFSLIAPLIFIVFINFIHTYLALRKYALIDIKNKSYYTVIVIFELIGAKSRWGWRKIIKR